MSGQDGRRRGVIPLLAAIVACLALALGAFAIWAGVPGTTPGLPATTGQAPTGDSEADAPLPAGPSADEDVGAADGAGDGTADADGSLSGQAGGSDQETVDASGNGPGAADAAGTPSAQDRLTRFSAFEDGRLLGSAQNGLGVRETWWVGLALEEAAAQALEQYMDAGDFRLVYAGRLDLLGRVWCCVVASPEGWGEVVIVDGRDTDASDEGDASCTVTVERLGGEDLAAQAQ